MRTRKRHYVVYKELRWIRSLLINPTGRLYGWCLLCSSGYTPSPQDWFTTRQDDVTCESCRKKLAKKL